MIKSFLWMKDIVTALVSDCESPPILPKTRFSSASVGEGGLKIRLPDLHKMKSDSNKLVGPGDAAAGQGGNSKGLPKHAALIGDVLFPMPRARLSARTILEQSGNGPEYVLVRDHGGPDDVTLPASHKALSRLATLVPSSLLPGSKSG